MGSYLFKWEHPANEVFVTGTFDDWGKTVLLEKKGDVHEKEVVLPKADETIHYKFVVDGVWTTDHTAPSDTDSSGNTNNILTADHIKKASLAQQVSAMVSGAASNLTTQQLAGQVPKENEEIPGAFPETPAAGESEVKVNPLPATAGPGNPISLKAGEPVPTVSGNTLTSTVTTDKESYEKGAGAPVLPNVVTPDAERPSGLFGLPEQTSNMIPESSLPVAGGLATSTIQSTGTGATTTQLAGQVPLEPRGVPEVVKDSQAEANASPEASANPEAVQDKKEVEKELEKKVPEQPAATESTIAGTAAAKLGAAAAGVTAAAGAAAAYITSGQATDDAKAKLPESTHPVIDKVAPNGAASNGASKDINATAISPAVPEPVQESIAAAHQSPEAAADSTAVHEKSQVESELLKTVKPDNSAGEPAPVAAAETSATAPKPTTAETLAPASAAAVATTAVAGAGAGAAATTAPVRDSARATDDAAGKKPSGPDSRDISPMTRPDGTHARPHVTTGIASATTPSKSAAAANPSTPTSEDKKSKRSSGFFRKLKDKFEHRKH